MKSTNVFICAIISLALSVSSCSEFIEENLNGSKVFLNSPADSTETNKYLQTFWWEPITGANSFRLQIASPTFDNVSEIVVDTLIKSNKFSYTLEPGRFEWRVRAENSTSSGPFSTRSLIVHQSSLENQKLQLISPLSAYITSSRNIEYQWQAIFGAKAYRLQVDTNNFADESKLVLNTTTANTKFTLQLSRDKTYQWRARAENDNEVSNWSLTNLLTLDATPPDKVVLLSPTSAQVLNRPASLQWSQPVGTAKYELMIYRSDGTTPFSSSFPMLLTSNSYSFNGGDFNETLQWKVRAIDAAGNTGAYSDLRSFVVQ